MQKTIALPPYPRGSHVVTQKIYEVGQEMSGSLEALSMHGAQIRYPLPCAFMQALPELSDIEMGMANIFSESVRRT